MFADRVQAGRALGEALLAEMSREVSTTHNLVVIGLPRGGVPVAAEVARVLGAPLDIIGVRKLGAPGQPELAIGAIGEGGVRVLNQALVDSLGVSEKQLSAVEEQEQRVLAERLGAFRRGNTPLSLGDKLVIVVDDGFATGATARAACLVAKAKGARRVVLAVPVAPRGEAERFVEADRVVVLETPEPFYGVGAHYRDFGQTTNDEVIALLDRPRADG